MSNNIQQTKATYGFSGHETFPFRLGWLHKGILAVKENPSVFSCDESIVTLGVGKNMVRSIRHWCTTLGLIQEVTRGSYEPTNMGNFLFSTEGTDPYLEDIGTLWLLHWKLATHQTRATTWYYVFNQMNRPEFSKLGLNKELIRMVESNNSKPPSIKTLERDIDCFVRTYATPHKTFSEENIECALIELNILKDFDESVRLSRGDKATLPDLIFISSLIDFFNKVGRGSRTMSAERIIHSEGSPGRVFVLDDNSVIQRLERLEELTNGEVIYDSTAGMRQVLFHGNPDPENYIIRYYTRG